MERWRRRQRRPVPPRRSLQHLTTKAIGILLQTTKGVKRTAEEVDRCVRLATSRLPRRSLCLFTYSCGTASQSLTVADGAISRRDTFTLCGDTASSFTNDTCPNWCARSARNSLVFIT